MQPSASISKLCIYPIKSCGILEVESAFITKYGLAAYENPMVMDRYICFSKFCSSILRTLWSVNLSKWMIIDSAKVFMSQRTVPKMALIMPKIQGDEIVLSAPGMDDLRVPVKPPSNKIECRLVFGFICFIVLFS
jgi:uncharacterized protein YcbX